MAHYGCVLALTGKAFNALQTLTSAISAWRATGSTVMSPLRLTCLAKAHADLGQFDEAWQRLNEAKMAAEETKETWFNAEIERFGGEITLMSPEPDAAKAEDHFKGALAVARQQQAKSFELRAARSLARLWRDQGKVPQARELLPPVYGWFTEGFDTRDLKEAKVLLEELGA
jgi:predicted ATPase